MSCNSVAGSNGCSNSALPPPESKNSTVSAAVSPRTSASACSVAAKPFASGTGWPASQQVTPGSAPLTWPYLVMTTPPSTRPSVSTATRAICHAALPAATNTIRPPRGWKVCSARRTASSGRTARRLAEIIASASFRRDTSMGLTSLCGHDQWVVPMGTAVSRPHITTASTAFSSPREIWRKSMLGVPSGLLTACSMA